MKNDGSFSLDVFPDEVSYNPWEFESCSETGFLLGDPFCWSPEIDSFRKRHAFVFVLNEQFVLRVASYSNNVIEMLNLDELTKDSGRDSQLMRMKVALSLNGNTLFVIAKTSRGTPATLKAWNISSGMLKAERNADFEVFSALDNFILVPLREGILLKTSRNTLALWNFELSECIRSWTDLEYISEVIPISEERVACDARSKVIIVDTTQEGIVSTINFHGNFIACNSKCHVMTTRYLPDDYWYGDYMRLQMQCGEQVLWEISAELMFHGFKAFSPSERYCVLLGKPFEMAFDTEALYVLDVLLGKTLHTLHSYANPFGVELDCKFVSEEECVTLTCFSEEVMGGFLKLFNVKSGDLLSEIALKSPVSNLAVFQPKCLIAIGFKDSKKVNVKFLQVKLPRNEDCRKSKRIKIHE